MNPLDDMEKPTHEFLLVRRLQDGTVRVDVHIPDSQDMLHDATKLLNDGLEKLCWADTVVNAERKMIAALIGEHGI